MSKARIINFKPTPRPKSNLIPFLSVVLIGALIMSMCNRTATAQGNGFPRRIAQNNTSRDPNYFKGAYRKEDTIKPNRYFGLAELSSRDTSKWKANMLFSPDTSWLFKKDTSSVLLLLSHRDRSFTWAEAGYRVSSYAESTYFLDSKKKRIDNLIVWNVRYIKNPPMPLPSPMPDTIPAKKYHYFLTIKRIDFNTWNKSIDTLQGVHSIIGKSLLKDQADFNYELASRQIQRIFEHMSVDSVLIQEPKKAK